MKKVRDADVRVGALELLLAAACGALICGSAEALCDGVNILVLHRMIFVSYDVAWMSPLAYLIFFLALALLLVTVSFALGRRIPFAWSVGVFGGLTIFSWLIPFEQISRVAALVLAIGVGVQLGRLAGPRAPAWQRAMRRSAATLAAFAVVAGGTVRLWRQLAERRGTASLQARAAGQPNVLFIVWDTARRANLSLYGYARPTTPRLQALAGHGVAFDHAFATAPWTLPSHGSLFTGLPAESAGGSWRRPIQRAPRTLAESFRDRGYLTGGFVSNLLYTSYESGLARGFVHYDDYPLSLHLILLHSSLGRTRMGTLVAEAGSRRAILRGMMGLDFAPSRAPGDIFRPANDVTDAFLDWQAHTGPRPFFAFINYYDAHGPYHAPAAWLTAVGGSPDKKMDRYDGAIAFLDHELGRITDSLARRGVLDHTLLIVLGDHGEHFGEHHLTGHANSLYLPLLEVPLVLVMPGALPDGRRIDEAVSLRDVAATILDLTGANDPAMAPGASLSRYWRGTEASPPPMLTATLDKGIHVDTAFPNSRGPMVAHLDDQLHYIRSGRGTEELYQWRLDTLEAVNRAGDPAMRPDLERMRRGALPRSLSWSARRDEVRRRG